MIVTGEEELITVQTSISTGLKIDVVVVVLVVVVTAVVVVSACNLD